MSEAPISPKRSPLARVFLSPDENRLRAGWRLLIQTILILVIGIMAGLALSPLLQLGLNLDSLLLQQLIQIIVITGSVFLARKLLDRRSISSLGLQLGQLALVDILAGIAITFFMMAAIYVIEVAMGWLTFKGFAWQFESGQTVLVNTLMMLAVFILVGWSEELLSRGYHLQTLASGINLFWGVVLSSAVFGLLHLGNPNATWISAVGIFLAGLFLAYGYITTRQLWLPIGLHIGWNFFEGVGFGFPVSGLDIYPLTRITIAGPVLWTGGAFGPEAGLVVLPGLALGAALIYLYSRFLRKEA
jgi:membrane protease YdiL (CAAX protease family)